MTASCCRLGTCRFIIGGMILLNTIWFLRVGFEDRSDAATSDQPSDVRRVHVSHQPHQSQAYTSIHACQLHNQTLRIPTVPKLIIIGAQKGGTSSMSKWLLQHPQVEPPRDPTTTETHYFDNAFMGQLNEFKSTNANNDSEADFYCRARHRYAEFIYNVPKLMSDMVDGRIPAITFDKTPGYIHLLNCPEYVVKTCPWGVKILVLLRNPIDRAYSQHQMDINKKRRTLPAFEERLRNELTKMRNVGLNRMPLLPTNVSSILDIDRLHFPSMNFTLQQEEEEAFAKLRKAPLLKKGLYAIQLRPWIRWIRRSDLLILNYDELKRDPDEAYRRVLKFVGLQDFSLTKYIAYHASNYQQSMQPTTRRYLERFFEPYNIQLGQLLGEEWRDVWKVSRIDK